ncbi:MAG TPA: SDR family NAD(P)-dependent oxidoreductase [Dongiaceae bacterium]|jgi:NAD(P)-dependent dehydrogenase (short-subunit alcohol dehydrogenase family)|nr:SDR family NAD(P)-dependent oxidoreductase [Dongiaceae bacterium]
MTSDPNLSGRRIVITGAGRGLGRALAIRAADHGANPVLLGRNPAALHKVADAIKSRTGRDVAIVPCDLAQADSIRDACRAVLAANPVVDVLINNGAPWLPGGITELADTEIATTVAAAVTGTILVTKGLLPGLRQSSAADVVTIVSTAGWTGWDVGGTSAAFHAAKHGQSGFSDALRHELKDQGIRVTAIYPPDFDDADPLASDWNQTGGKLSNREVVGTVLFAITAPRACAYPVIILDHLPAR